LEGKELTSTFPGEDVASMVISLREGAEAVGVSGGSSRHGSSAKGEKEEDKGGG